MKNKRKPLSKKLRFEVFKRDSFTCQYCGQMAPDIVLEVDHINPVADGGDNDIMNLVTSCFDCNRGKGKRILSDNDVIKKQQEQLKELNEKREQLKMMLEWKEELNNFIDEQIDACDEMLNEYGRELNDVGRDRFKKWINKFGFNEVYEAFETSLQQYANPEDQQSYAKAINYVPKIINNKKRMKEDPFLKNKYYIRGILKNRGMLYNENRVWAFLNYAIDTDEDVEIIQETAKTARNWTVFWEEANEIYNHPDGGGW